MTHCPKCREWFYSESHKCHPPWLVWTDDDGEENAVTIHAFDAESAAEEWAERDDRESVEYSIVGGNDATVTVRALEGGPSVRFVVSGESVPTYTARELP